MREAISTLFRELESEVGSSDLHRMAIRSFRAAITEFEGRTIDSFLDKFEGLYEDVLSTKPKFAIIIDFMYDVLLLARNLSARKSAVNWKKDLIAEVNKLEFAARSNMEKLIEAAMEIPFDGKTIMLHDHSHTVQRVLRAAKKLGKDFNVIVAEQEEEKTGGTIEFLSEIGVPFQVVPAYMLSHIENQVDMLFFGAVTLKSTFDFVMAPGTHAVIAEFNTVHAPIYMFIESAKWSLWRSGKKDTVHIHKQTRHHHLTDTPFERIKYSHDRVPLHFFKYVVTEQGIRTPSQIKTMFRTLQHEHKGMYPEM